MNERSECFHLFGGGASHSLSAIQIKIIFIWAAERKNERSEARLAAALFMKLIVFLFSLRWVMGGGTANGSVERKRTKQKSKLMESNQTKKSK